MEDNTAGDISSTNDANNDEEFEVAESSTSNQKFWEMKGSSIECSKNTAFFYVQKVNPYYTVQLRVIQIDYAQKVIRTLSAGEVKKCRPFSLISDAERDPSDPMKILLFFRDFSRYEIMTATPDNRDEIYHRFKDIIKATSRDDDDELVLLAQPQSVLAWASAKKKGKLHYASRWIVLFRLRLVFFKSPDSALPVNIVELGATKVVRVDARTIQIQMTFRNFVLRFYSEDECNRWLKLLNEARDIDKETKLREQYQPQMK